MFDPEWGVHFGAHFGSGPDVEKFGPIKEIKEDVHCLRSRRSKVCTAACQLTLEETDLDRLFLGEEEATWNDTWLKQTCITGVLCLVTEQFGDEDQLMPIENWRHEQIDDDVVGCNKMDMLTEWLRTQLIPKIMISCHQRVRFDYDKKRCLDQNVSNQIADPTFDPTFAEALAIENALAIDQKKETLQWVECAKCADKPTPLPRIMVVCYSGNSLSASIVVAYLIRYHHLRADEAITFLQSIRQGVQPVAKLMNQLYDYDRVCLGRRICFTTSILLSLSLNFIQPLVSIITEYSC